jgi:alcohol dehydrogenase (cytochrome c)
MDLESCSIYERKPAGFEEGKEYYSTGTKRVPNEKSQKVLQAYDPQTKKFVWRYRQEGEGFGFGGVMSTAAGLIFFCDNQGFFEAADAKTGKSLWHFSTGQSLHASPMSYAVDGHQYVAIAAGSDLFTFALPTAP